MATLANSNIAPPTTFAADQKISKTHMELLGYDTKYPPYHFFWGGV